MNGDALKPANWDGFFAVLEGIEILDDFRDLPERAQGMHCRDPFEGWVEDGDNRASGQQ